MTLGGVGPVEELAELEHARAPLARLLERHVAEDLDVLVDLACGRPSAR